MRKGEYYTYLWLRDDGTPFYVGKGRWIGFKSQERVFRKGSPSIDRIVIQTHPSEQDAFFAECFLIDFYGRKDLGTGPLRNLTNGGEGFSGHIWSLDHRRKVSEALREYRLRFPIEGYNPEEHSKKMLGHGNPMFGKKRFIDRVWREKLSEGRRGKVFSDETRVKMSAASKGRSKKGQTHCYRGHEFTPENTRIGKSGSRFCLACSKVRHDAANARARERRVAA